MSTGLITTDQIGRTLAAHMQQFEALAQDGEDIKRFCRMFTEHIASDPRKAACTLESVIVCAKQAVTIGIFPDTTFGRAYLIPRKRSVQSGGQWTKVLELHYQLGYKGWLELLGRSGEVSDVQAGLVYQGDKWNWVQGSEPNFELFPSLGGRSDDNAIAAYCVVNLYNGRKFVNVMDRAQIEDHKEKYSEGWKWAEKDKKDSPWHTQWGAMAIKTCILQLVYRGVIPTSTAVKEQAYKEWGQPQEKLRSEPQPRIGAVERNAKALDAITQQLVEEQQSKAITAEATEPAPPKQPAKAADKPKPKQPAKAQEPAPEVVAPPQKEQPKCPPGCPQAAWEVLLKCDDASIMAESVEALCDDHGDKADKIKSAAKRIMESW